MDPVHGSTLSGLLHCWWAATISGMWPAGMNLLQNLRPSSIIHGDWWKEGEWRLTKLQSPSGHFTYGNCHGPISSVTSPHCMPPIWAGTGNTGAALCHCCVLRVGAAVAVTDPKLLPPLPLLPCALAWIQVTRSPVVWIQPGMQDMFDTPDLQIFQAFVNTRLERTNEVFFLMILLGLSQGKCSLAAV